MNFTKTAQTKSPFKYLDQSVEGQRYSQKVSKFKSLNAPTAAVASPAELFYQLRRSDEIKHLWAHQRDVLDLYVQNSDSRNLALELPTGCGKTLIAMLIGEFCRREKDQRVVYLCPTKQLCAQVQNQAGSYGIKTTLLVGPKRNFDKAEFNLYETSKSIAVTTYSALFNSYPAFGDPDLILLDDAHAAENYISNMWSMSVTKSAHEDFFDAIVTFLAESIPQEMYQRIRSGLTSPWDDSAVQLVPLPLYVEHIDDLEKICTRYCIKDYDEELYYSRGVLGGHLHACNIYISSSRILIRPYIPPTLTHAPFANADQRIFMSATLGSSGDLERFTGIGKIKRVPVPGNWDQKGTGRRLILFPDLIKDANAPEKMLTNFVEGKHRTLILTPDGYSANALRDKYEEQSTILGAEDVEKSLTPFTTQQPPAALILANRYDGIDLQGDACRQLVVAGLPASTDLQEKFLHQKLGATSLLRDRIRTRLTQGLGRCTRDESDYSIALLIGDPLLSWCSKGVNTRLLNADLQAEIEFGRENSSVSLDEALEYCNIFLQHEDDWDEAEQAIVNIRAKKSLEVDDLALSLGKSVEAEVNFVYSLWQNDAEKAYENAVIVADAIDGGSDAKPYRAFWFYNACVAADQAYRQSKNPNWLTHYSNEVERARKCTIGITWFSTLRNVHKKEEAPSVPDINVGEIRDLLNSWQLVGGKFETRLAEARSQIYSNEFTAFGLGVRTLGLMLGIEAFVWPASTSGATDGLWVFSSGQSIVFEHKSMAQITGSISMSEVRQAKAHPAWTLTHRPDLAAIKMSTVMVTQKPKIKQDAQAIAEGIWYSTPQFFRSLFDEAADVLTKVRNLGRDLSEEQLDILIGETYVTKKLTGDEIRARVFTKQLKDVQKE